MLIERGDAEICEKHPGREKDLVVVVSDPVAFAAGISESSSGATPCAAGRSRCGAHARWRRALPTWKRAVLSPVTNPSPPDRQLDNAAERIAELTEASSARPLASARFINTTRRCIRPSATATWSR